MRETELCFLTGAAKTGTSTLTGMLNCHPEVLLLYEVDVGASRPTRYGRRFLEAYPGARSLFSADGDPAVPYRRLARWLHDRGHRYRILGDKFPTTDASQLERFGDHRVIVMVRDLRTWLAKNTIIATYVTAPDVVPAAIEYVRFLVRSARLDACLRLRLEDLLGDPDAVVARLGGFLELDLKPHLDGWWSKVGRWGDDDPKSCLRWWAVHPSATAAPRGPDTTIVTKPHPFWDEVLPLFDRYAGAAGPPPDPDRVAADLRRVASWRRLSPVPLADCYESIASATLGAGDAAPSWMPARLDAGVLTNEMAAHLAGPT